MKKLLFFDCETTGLPVDFNAPPEEFAYWPELVQLGWMLTDDTGRRLKWYNEMVKPRVKTLNLLERVALRKSVVCKFSPGWHIPPDMVHGISHERAMSLGLPIGKVLEAFRIACAQADCLIAHNADFDLPVIRATYFREGEIPPISHLPVYCTQKQTTHVARIKNYKNGRGYGLYKWPSLAELHGFCKFGIIEDAHDALADVEATARCFFHIREHYPDAFADFYLRANRTCMFCGCDDDDCSQCITAQGFPCSWINDRCCSRCEHLYQQSLQNFML